MLSLLSVKFYSCGFIYDSGIWFIEGYLSTEKVKRKLYYNIQFRPLYIEQKGILSELRFYYKLDMFYWRSYVKYKIFAYIAFLRLLIFNCYFEVSFASIWMQRTMASLRKDNDKINASSLVVFIDGGCLSLVTRQHLPGEGGGGNLRFFFFLKLL